MAPMMMMTMMLLQAIAEYNNGMKGEIIIIFVLINH